MQKNDYETANRNLIEAQGIFTALRGSFHGNDALAILSRKIMQLLVRELVLANAHQDRQRLADARELIRQLTESYKSRMRRI